MLMPVHSESYNIVGFSMQLEVQSIVSSLKCVLRTEFMDSARLVRALFPTYHSVLPLKHVLFNFKKQILFNFGAIAYVQ